MKKITALFDGAIAARAKKEKRLKRTIRKHTVEALVSQTAGTLLELSERQANDLLDGNTDISPSVAMLLSTILGLPARDILDARTDDLLAAEGDTSTRVEVVGARETPRSKPAVTRTSPMKAAPRRTEVSGTL